MERVVMRVGGMERVKSQDVGRGMAWKGPASSSASRRKGLGEIEDIGKEEVSNKMMQALERFMMAHPAVWSESSVQHLLVEVADTRYISDSMTREHLQKIINRILVPMANITEAEHEAMMVERQRNHEASFAVQRAREECHQAMEGMKQEHDRATKDLEELRKSLEETRAAAEESQRKLAAKEKELHDMAETQRSLVLRLACGGPAAFMEWARGELQSPDDQAWMVTVRDQVEDKMLVPDECSSNSSNGYNYRDSAKPWSSWTLNLLCLVVSEVVRQMVESYDRVKSPLSLPFAIAGFWIGLARRFSFLALSLLLPQLVEASPAQKGHQSHQPIK